MSFGELFQKARIRAGFSTVTALADHLSLLGIVYSDGAIDHWENDRRKPPREKLLPTLSVLAERGGITDLRLVNEMLWQLDWRSLSEDEQHTYFANLTFPTNWENLPERPFDELVGRDDVVADLLARLTNPTFKPVLVLSGLGGIGKTAIAYELVRRALSAGQFERLAWESTRSEEFMGISIRVRQAQQVSEHSILMNIATQLGFEALTRTAPQLLPTRLREVVRAGSYLIVLDNLETLQAAHEIAAMLHTLVSPSVSDRPSKVLITSRERLVEVPYVFDFFVHGLSEPASLELLQLEARMRSSTPPHLDQALAHRIFTVTGGMPLALKLMVSQYLLGIRLETELDRLEGAADEEELYRFIYFRLWEQLSIPAQKILVGAATFGTSAMRAMLMRVSRMLLDSDFDAAIAELVKASLIEVIMPRSADQQQRYDLHPITRWFINGPLTELWNRQKGG